ncbi:hypothetical protein BGZ80_004244 [Entomortierella chlamydospora]|uniref:Galactose oxidase n=1 Tax=Entomortierella chlamydospora TaxID=101097 RepID=A0A9P6SW08_9FUNG|nr:hypothetical protein BGZ80_004244 [Entomortierella chlamydospora]
MSKPPSTKHFVTRLVLLFVLSLSLSITHAQSTSSNQTESSATSLSPTPTTSPTSNSTVTPTPTILAPSAITGIASAAGNGVIFYQGGQLNVPVVQYTNDFFSLDTTKSWNTSSPAWTNLTNVTGGPTSSGHSATMSSDLKTLYVTAPTDNTTINATAPFLYKYNVKSGTWSSESAPSAQATIWFTRKEANLLTDHRTGALWYLGGMLKGGIETNEMDRYQGGLWNTNIPTTYAGMSATEGTSVLSNFSSGTSHIYGTKIYLFGGFSSVNGTRTYLSFQNLNWVDISTATPTVGTQLTLGSVPSPRQDHCSVLTASNKVIVFGGYDANTRTTYNDIWSLDLITLTWSQILPLGISYPAYGHNCNLAGAMMIVFAGLTTTSLTDPRNDTFDGYRSVQVYDVMTTQWLKTYTPKNDTTPISVLGPGVSFGDSAGTSKRFGPGAIAGTVIGCVTLIGCAVGIVIYKKRQDRIKIRKAEMEKNAYLISLVNNKGTRDENRGSNDRRRRQRSHRNNPYAAGSSTRQLNGYSTSTGPSHCGYSGAESHSGREDDDLATSEPEGGVQYLMQQLPDGSIAVQPVYLNHQPFQFQVAPNIAYSETSSLGGIIGASLTRSPSLARAGVGDSSKDTGGFISSPLPFPTSFQDTEATSTSENTPSGDVDPLSTNSSESASVPPPAQNPFASPSALNRVQSVSSSRSSPKSHGRRKDSHRRARD